LNLAVVPAAMKPPLTFIDLFCGCGGFSLGLQRAGLKGLAAIDFNPEVFDIEPNPFYNGWKWDYARLPGRKTAFASAEPFAVSLVEVLSAHRVRI